MSKKTESTDPADTDTATVRLRRDYIRRLDRLARHFDQKTPGYLAELLSPILDAAEDQMARDLEREREQRRRDEAGKPKPSPRRGGSSD